MPPCVRGNFTFTHEVEHLRPALAEALEQQTATAEVLRVIASSQSDSRAALQAIITSAWRLISVMLRPSGWSSVTRRRSSRAGAQPFQLSGGTYIGWRRPLTEGAPFSEAIER